MSQNDIVCPYCGEKQGFVMIYLHKMNLICRNNACKKTFECERNYEVSVVYLTRKKEE